MSGVAQQDGPRGDDVACSRNSFGRRGEKAAGDRCGVDGRVGRSLPGEAGDEGVGAGWLDGWLADGPRGKPPPGFEAGSVLYGAHQEGACRHRGGRPTEARASSGCSAYWAKPGLLRMYMLRTRTRAQCAKQLSTGCLLPGPGNGVVHSSAHRPPPSWRWRCAT